MPSSTAPIRTRRAHPPRDLKTQAFTPSLARARADKEKDMASPSSFLWSPVRAAASGVLPELLLLLQASSETTSLPLVGTVLDRRWSGLPRPASATTRLRERATLMVGTKVCSWRLFCSTSSWSMKEALIRLSCCSVGGCDVAPSWPGCC